MLLWIQVSEAEGRGVPAVHPPLERRGDGPGILSGTVRCGAALCPKERGASLSEGVFGWGLDGRAVTWLTWVQCGAVPAPSGARLDRAQLSTIPFLRGRGDGRRGQGRPLGALLSAPPPPAPQRRLTPPPPPARDALEGKGPQRRPQERVDRRLEEVAKAVGGRLLSATNAVEAGTWRQGDSAWAGGG